MECLFRAFVQTGAAADAVHGIGGCIGGQSHGADFFAQTAAVAGGICLVAIGAAFVEKTEKGTKGAKIFAKGPFDYQRQQENCGKTQQLYSRKAGFPCLPIGKKQGG